MKVKINGSFFLSVLLSLCLVLLLPFSALADLAVDDQTVIATNSDASRSRSLDIAPFSSISTIQNTISYSGASVVLSYYDMSNVFRQVHVSIASDGSFKINRPSNLAKGVNLMIHIEKKSLPPSGNYKVIADFALHTPMLYGSSVSYFVKSVNNAASEDLYSSSLSLVQNYGDFQVSGVVKLGYVDVYQIGATISGTVPTVIAGVVQVNFSSSSTSADILSPGANTASQDIQNNISDNTSQMVDKQEETNGLLVQIISTISNQLTAFWNQLAGEFTNLYNKMNQQHREKLDADRQNTDDIISNQNENTNQVLNGYDSSKLDDSSNNLNNSLTEYNDINNGISESIGYYLENFEYRNLSDYPSGVLGSLLFFGNYMQRIFESMNNFNLPITLGFTLAFVLMLIGYFRYGR